ncbi:uncharacterized protein C22orf15 homolog isoform X2 [Neofelis nebulosa]|uniref:uncharacterized protein C22orf15 homolog isoform X2 n=1 Tax=Neofelis nebulosa TaxID=61452 RepID=UPI00272AF863|nr:uncharacterized protein C22orf15 homolog isoform X2 [Neofelis nebulosa]
MVRGHGGVLGRRGQGSPGRGTSPCLAFLPTLPATIALLAEDGHLVSLDEGASQAPSMGSPLLQERGTYVLVQIIKGDDGAPTRYESLLENLDDQCPELAGESHTTAPGGGCAFSPPPIDRASWAFQRSFAACQAYNPQVMAGGGARALGVTTRSKAPFQSHEGRDPCHPGPVSWGQEPGKEETQTPGGMLTPRSPSEQTYVC